jgi:phosphatidylinositol-3-phosphatase
MTHRALRSKLFLAVSLLMAVLVMPARPAWRQSGLSSIKTVFVILFENTNWASITPSVAPYIRTTVVPMGAHATQYFNPPGNHPSEPNYIWLEAGHHLGLTTNNDASTANSTATEHHLVRYLRNAGISWRTYQEDIDGTICPLTSDELSRRYVAKHNPFVFFRDLTDNNSPSSLYCIAHNRPFTDLATDLRKNTVARYNFITPNLCNDMHDCGIKAGDTWLSQNLPVILNSQAYQNNGAVFITWDEGANGSDGPIGMIVVSPLAKVNYANSIYYTHSSTLRTMQEIFGVRPLLRGAANATDLSDLFAEDRAGRPGKGH